MVDKTNKTDVNETNVNTLNTNDLNKPIGSFSLTETRTIRGSGDTFRTDEKPADENMLKRDHGEKAGLDRYEVFENVQHEVKVKMTFDGDTLTRIAQFAFSELWIKQQAKMRKEIEVVGDEEFGKRLKKTDGIVECKTLTDFEPKSRALTDADKAVGAIGKVDDMEDLARLEEQLQAQKEKILANMKAKNGVR